MGETKGKWQQPPPLPLSLWWLNSVKGWNLWRDFAFSWAEGSKAKPWSLLALAGHCWWAGVTMLDHRLHTNGVGTLNQALPLPLPLTVDSNLIEVANTPKLIVILQVLKNGQLGLLQNELFVE